MVSNPSASPTAKRHKMQNDNLRLASESRFSPLNEADRFYEKLLSHAAQWGIDNELTNSLKSLNSLRGDPRKLATVSKLLEALLSKQQQKLGDGHVSLARTEMLLGICLQKMRESENSVKRLRSAVTRFQNSDDVERDIFVDCLCALSSSYRDTTNYDASRTCIKQVYRLLPPEDAPLRLQCAALEELAADLLCEHRFKSALEGYERVVTMRAELLKTEINDIVRPLIQLGMCHFALHQLDGAEQCMIKAGQSYHQLKYDDRDLLVQILDALAGTMRHKAQFMQADILEEAALEIRGRSEQMGGHMLYGNLLKEAQAAEEHGDNGAAKVKYREALTALESQRQKRVVERLHILAKLMLLTNGQQFVQRSSLLSDIEDSVRAIFCGAVIGTREGIERIALLYELSGRTLHAKSLRLLAEDLKEKVLPHAPSNGVVGLEVNSRPQASPLLGTVDAVPHELPRLEWKISDIQDVEEV